ncbi:MAG: hypothetical protein ACI9NQ_001759 [Paracoccaceae bacterium]|jgi:hypothetical protein
MIIVAPGMATMLLLLPFVFTNRVGQDSQGNGTHRNSARAHRLTTVSIGIITCTTAYSHRSDQNGRDQFHQLFQIFHTSDETRRVGIKFKQTARFFSLDSREHSRRLTEVRNDFEDERRCAPAPYQPKKKAG